METIFIQVGVISSISGVLALLLSVANKTIGNYGEKQMIINEEKDYTVEGGDSLLSTLIGEDIFIPSACGGKGSCGYCKVKVTSGGGPFLPTEAGYVSKEEQKEGIRLSCQLKVKEDIYIALPEELFNVKQYDYLVENINDVTPKIKHLCLSLPNEKEIHFKPGQYIQILTPPYKGNDEEVYRAYSIASSPENTHGVELLVGYIPEGVCTTYIHQHLKIGDTLTVVGPFGDFYYQDGEKPMVMVAVGTGMAPILSILKYMAAKGIDRQVTFFFGARTKEDLYMIDTLNDLEKSLPHFKLQCCLSRPEEKDKWTGDVGRVTNLIETYVDNGIDKEAYLCGSPKMIDSVVEVLRQKGFEETAIYYDKFE